MTSENKSGENDIWRKRHLAKTTSGEVTTGEEKRRLCGAANNGVGGTANHEKRSEQQAYARS
jgi:hypothetical protein